MPRESTIQVYRSTTTAVPTGLTFGELAFSDINGTERLFVGGSAGNTVWIGAEITAGDISTNSTTLVPTQSAVKGYVDGIVGGGSGVVNTVNGTGGNITITGDAGAITLAQSGKTGTVGIRLASTSATGVASFNSSYFSVASGAVSLASAYQTTGDSVSAGVGVAATRSGNSVTINNVGVTSFNGSTGAITYYPPTATTSVTGMASFNSTYFSVASGAVSLASAYQTTGDNVSAGVGIGVTRSGNSVTINNIGVTSVNGLTGAISNIAVTNAAQTFSGLQTFTNGLSSGSTITVNNAVQGLTNTNALVLRTAVNSSNYITIGATGNNMTMAPGSGVMRVTTGYGTGTWSTFGAQRAKLALQGNDGDAVSYDVTIDPSSALSANRTLTCPNDDGTIALTKNLVSSANGATGALTITGDGASQLVTVSGTTTTFSNRLASTSATGVASFNSSHFSVSSGAVSLASAYQTTGDSVSAGVGINVTRSGNSVTINNIGVTSVNGLTGAISNIAVTNNAQTFSGLQTFSTGITAANLFVSGGATFNSNISAPNIVTSTNSFVGAVSITGTANQVSVSNSSNTVTVGLPNDVTITGNLTVNGTVVTANVDTFIVEDPMFMLGTGNAADSVDLGFYAQYTSGGRRFAGLFRDASDGKFRLFAGLSGDAEPTTTVNIGGTGFAITTLIANIDGGTF